MCDGSMKKVDIFELIVELLLQCFQRALDENVLRDKREKGGMLREREIVKLHSLNFHLIFLPSNFYTPAKCHNTNQ